MNVLEIIDKYYDKNSELYRILIDHSQSVTDKALSIAKARPDLNIDIQFVQEAAMLHDIGIFKTHASSIHCTGEYPYVAHGYLGSELMKEEGYPKHALVCERHTGSGITLEQIVRENLPIPHRDMLPISIEEKLICFADKFYSKTKLGKEKDIDTILNKLSRFGEEEVQRFKDLCTLFL